MPIVFQVYTNDKVEWNRYLKVLKPPGVEARIFHENLIDDIATEAMAACAVSASAAMALKSLVFSYTRKDLNYMCHPVLKIIENANVFSACQKSR